MGMSLHDIADKHPEHKDLNAKRQELKIKLNDIELQLMTCSRSDSDKRSNLIVSKEQTLSELREINNNLRGTHQQINSLIIDIIRESMPENIFAKIYVESYNRLKGGPKNIISLLSDEEENAVSYFRQLDNQYKDIKIKFRTLEKTIQEEIPNIAKAKTEKEHIAATAVFKVLSKLNRIINDK